MQREIKFRAKRVQDNEWVYWEPRDNLSGYAIVKWDTLCEFTGLKDKNGKEIYEGDIINNGVAIEKVSYDNKRSAFDYGNLRDEDYNLIYPEYFEIIGNICENKDLLK